MTKAKATPIGEVQCPIEGCTLVIPVFKFRPKSDDARFHRFAHKWYCRCPVDGTFGFDGAKGIQEHIANKGKLWGDQPPSAQPAPDANREASKPAAATSTSTSSSSTASRTPSSTPISRPSSSGASPAPAAPKPRMKLYGWSQR